MTDINQAWPTTRSAWWLTASLTFAYSLAFLHRIGLSLFVEPLRRDFSLTDTDIGLLTGACFAIPYTLSAPLAGWLIDRYDRRRLLAAAGILWSAATGFGVFTYAGMLVGRVLTGIGQSVVQPGSTSLISDVFPPERRSAGYGIFVAGTAFGTAGAYLAGALAVVIGERWSASIGLRDWQVALLVVAALGLLIPVAVLANPEPARRERSVLVLERTQILRFMHARAWVLFALFGGVTLTFLAPYGQLAFMPSLFIRKFGWTAELVAVRFGLIAAVVGAIGSFLGGYLGTSLARRGNDYASWLVCLLGAAGCLLPGALAPLMPSGELALLMFGLSGLFANWSAVAVLAAIVELTPNELRGQVTAVYTSCVGLFAAGLGPLTVGFLNDHLTGAVAGIDVSLSLTFAGCAIGALALLSAGLPAFRRLRLPLSEGRQQTDPL